MTHIWVRAEERPHEERCGSTPEGVERLLAAGYQVTVEESSQRAISVDGYRATGAEIAPEGSWRTAPRDAIIFGRTLSRTKGVAAITPDAAFIGSGVLGLEPALSPSALPDSGATGSVIASRITNICGTTERTRRVISSAKPFITDKTTTSEATPIPIPNIESTDTKRAKPRRFTPKL